MEFGLALECDERSAHVSPILTSLEDSVSLALSSGHYGIGLDHIFVGMILLPGHWEGHERRPFKFEKECGVRTPFGTTEVLHNVVSIDAMVDPQLLQSVSASEQRRILSRAILAALDEVGEQRSKFPHVQFDDLRRDVAEAIGH